MFLQQVLPRFVFSVMDKNYSSKIIHHSLSYFCLFVVYFFSRKSTNLHACEKVMCNFFLP